MLSNLLRCSFSAGIAAILALVCQVLILGSLQAQSIIPPNLFIPQCIEPEHLNCAQLYTSCQDRCECEYQNRETDNVHEWCKTSAGCANSYNQKIAQIAAALVDCIYAHPEDVGTCVDDAIAQFDEAYATYLKCVEYANTSKQEQTFWNQTAKVGCIALCSN